MDATAAETTQDWLLPQSARPPLIGELECRIEEALAIARSSEAAVMAVGEAALDAAEQARRAAELAQRSSAIALESQRVPSTSEPAGDASMRDFHARADYVSSRLRALQRLPLAGETGLDVESLR